MKFAVTMSVLCLACFAHCKENFASQYADDPKLSDKEAVKKIIDTCVVRATYDLRGMTVNEDQSGFRVKLDLNKDPKTATRNLEMEKDGFRRSAADTLLCSLRVGEKRKLRELTISYFLVFSKSKQISFSEQSPDAQEVYRFSLAREDLGDAQALKLADSELVASKMKVHVDDWEGIGFVE